MSTKQEFLVIKKQAVHYEVSEIIRDSTTNWEAMYCYPAAKNYVGSDEVEIETSRGSDGVSPSTEIEIK